MKKTQKMLLLSTIWILSLESAFVGGVYFRIAYWVNPCGVMTAGTYGAKETVFGQDARATVVRAFCLVPS
jgi:hypothetical protein